jgi:hypothetical protein
LLPELKDEAIERQRQLPAQETVAGELVFVADAQNQIPYVGRPDLAEAFETLWTAPASYGLWLTSGRICLIGDAGTGKTRSVRERAAFDRSHWIDATDVEGHGRSATSHDLLSRAGREPQ